MALKTVFTKQLAAASSNNIALSQSPGTAALTLNGSAVTGGIATIDTAASANSAIGRRVIITSGGDDSGITWTVVGTNSTGNAITDTFAGSNGGGAQSNLDFVKVSKITPSAAVASTVIVGTNGVGSSPWILHNWNGYSPMNIGIGIELVSGVVNFTIQHTYDDPNNLEAGALYPFPFNDAVINQQSGSMDGAMVTPIIASRIVINSGTGEIRVRFLQAGAG